MVSEKALDLIAGDTKFAVRVIRSRRRRSRISLQLNRSAEVVVRAPMATPDTEVMAFVQRSAAWLKKKYQELEFYPALRYEAGELHPYLGAEYPLVFIARDGRANVDLVGENICLYGGQFTPDVVERRLAQWYVAQARTVFAARLVKCVEELQWVKGLPSLRLRRMKSRWGSCSQDGRICLNTQLIKFDQTCIDYVVIHELCHLREFNHSPAFYALMADTMPDWKDKKLQLESSAAYVLRD